MTTRLLLIRKLLFYYRKSKFRRTKNSKKCPALVSNSINCMLTSADREKYAAELLNIKSLIFFGGWMGVNNFSFITITLIIWFFSLSFGFPVEKGVRPEIPDIQQFRFSNSVLNATRNQSTPVFSDSSSYFNPENIYKNKVYDYESNFKTQWNYNNTGIKIELPNSIGNSSVESNTGNFKRTKRRLPERTKRKRLFVTDDIQNYLMTYGYLPPSDKETGLLRTEDQLKSAIKNLQRFANIPATGELDEVTLELFKKPRCGSPDIIYPSSRKKRYTLHGQKWLYTNLTWSLRTFQPRNLDGGRVRAVLYHALDVWAKHSSLTIREVNSDRADILVYFQSGYHGDGYAFDGRGQVLAHAFFPGKERGGDAHFDEDEIWILDPYADLEKVEGTSLFAVAAHEFGHSLGLSHSSVQGALMFPWYQGYEGLTPDLQLPDDDKHAIQQLYGPKDTKLWAKIPTYKPYQPERPRTEPPRTTPRPTRPPRPVTTARPYTTPTPRPRPTPRVPQYPKVPEKIPGKPDTCNTSYDAISVIRNEVFVFKDKYLWRLGDNGLRNDYPAEINRLWYGLPKDLTHVDAVYERNDKKIVFFIGKLYYVFNANYVMPGYPKPIHYLGLPRELDHVDAAMVWGHNGKTYFFSGTMYWRFDEEVGRVELDYPRDMSMWRGVGYNIDAVFQWKDGNTYFFKNKGFWKFNDMRMRVENERQTLSAPFWMGCPRTNEIDEPEPTKPKTKERLISSASTMISNFYCLIIMIFAGNIIKLLLE